MISGVGGWKADFGDWDRRVAGEVIGLGIVFESVMVLKVLIYGD